MSKHVAVITTGGTIGAVITGTAIVSGAHLSRLASEIDQVKVSKGLSVEVFPIFEKMSEDMLPSDWGVIIRSVQDLISQGYQSIVMTHGTDTMAYAAAAIALYFNDNRQGAKICLTGAFYPIESPQSDARINLEAALDVVTSAALPSGVYVSFRQEQSEVSIYHGLEIIPMSFDGSTFGAMYGRPAARYRDGKIRDIQPRFLNVLADCDVPHPQSFQTVGRHIHQVSSYPGLDLSPFATPAPENRLILVGGYHCGTASSLRGMGSLIDFKQRNPHIQIALSCVPSVFIEIPYQSTVTLMDAGISVYRDLSPLVLYVLSTCRFAMGVSFDELLSPAAPWVLNARSKTSSFTK